MHIHVLSDLHLEFAPFEAPAPDADVVVLAGDTDRGLRGLEWAARTFNVPVVYIAGNHEYYGHKLYRLDEKLAARAAELAIHFLQQQAVVIEGIRFLGATLWTDLAAHGDPTWATHDVESAMNDYRLITVPPPYTGAGYRKLRAGDTRALHRTMRQWLEAALREPFEGPTVVVTHHAPSLGSQHPDFAGDPVAAAYVSDMDDIVAESGAALWIHGHTHTTRDVRIGKTRLLANCRGYADEEAAGFDPGLVVSV